VETLTDIQKRNRLAIIIVSVIGLLSSFSFTMTVFAWGNGETTIYYLLLYPAFLITTILVIAKVRFAYFLTIILALAYATILNKEIGDYFIFRSYNDVLIWVLVLPYLAFLALVPLTILFLVVENQRKRLFTLTALIVALSFPIFAIAERFDMDYTDSICMDFNITESGLIRITGKPGFADNRQFTITTNSRELAKTIKDEGELFYGSYVFVNTRVTKNFRFSKFQSLTIKKLKDKRLDFDLIWSADEIKGDISFLKP